MQQTVLFTTKVCSRFNPDNGLKLMIKRSVILFVAVLCVACGPDGLPVVVPTLMDLPTQTAAPPTLTPDVALPSSNTALPTDSPVVPTDTPTATATVLTITVTATQPPTETPSVTPSLTITPTPTYTPSATWTITPTYTPTEPPSALSGLVALALQATVLPQAIAPPVQPQPQPLLPQAPVAAAPPCASPPAGSFGIVYASDPTNAALLGCPLSGEYSVITAVQTFERGMMVYVSGQPGVIYALYTSGTFRRYTDTFVEGVDPEQSGESAPPGFLVPIRGFLKVWTSNPDVRAGLGWAITEEAGHESRVLQFERGRMIYLPQRNQTIVLGEDAGGETGTWRAVQGGG